MNIFMLLYLKYPDIRVEKEVKTFLKNGYNVTIMALNNGTQEEILQEGNLVIYRPREYSYSCLWKGFRYFWGSVNFVDRWVLKKCQDYISKRKFDVIHIHDLRLVKVGVLLGRQYNLKVVADLHENYPAAIKSYTEDNSIKSIIRRHTVDRYDRWVAYEKKILQEVDAVIVVVDEAKMRIARDCGVNKDKIYVVSNTESESGFGQMKVDLSVVDRYKDDFLISYIGGVDYHRGLDTVIKALPAIIKCNSSVKFLIVGGGSDDACKKYLQYLAYELGVGQFVEFAGQIPFSKVPSYIAASKMGVIAQVASEHGNYTVPHKLFQYMVMGRPVIVSDCYPLKRIVLENNCGVVFKSNDSESLVDCFENLHDVENLGKNAKKAVRETYNWENDACRLITLYEELCM